MPDRAVRLLLSLALSVGLVAAVAAAEASIEGVWLGVSAQIGSVYRLQLDAGGSGTLQYVSHVGEQPELRSYTVRDWTLDGGKVRFELEPREGAPRLQLRGKLKSGQLDLEIVRRKGDKPEGLRMSPEDRFLADFELIRGTTVGD